MTAADLADALQAWIAELGQDGSTKLGEAA